MPSSNIGIARLIVVFTSLCVLAAALALVPAEGAPADRFRQDVHLPPTVTSIDRVLAGPGDLALQLGGKARPGSVVAVYANAVCLRGGNDPQANADRRGVWSKRVDIPKPGNTQVPPRWISVRSWVTNGAVSRCRIVELPDSARAPVFAPGTTLIGGIDYAVPQGDGVVKVVGWIADLGGTPRRSIDITVPNALLPVPPLVVAKAKVISSPVMSRVLPGWVRGFVAFVNFNGDNGERLCAQTRVSGVAKEFACIVPQRDSLEFLGFPTLGRISSIVRTGDVVRVKGWAARSFSRSASSVSIRANGRKVGTVRASIPVQGLARFLPGMGSAHGFDYTFAAGPKQQRVCVSPAVPSGYETLVKALDCRVLPSSD